MASGSIEVRETASSPRGLTGTDEYLRRQGIIKLLEIKDSDIRILTLEQCRDAVDKGLHSGGAFSATIPLVALYYGGFISPDIADPTRRGQDVFVLSKGHAVAALASIYAELGYFDHSVLKNSRSYESILNGHPGPLLPGVHVATGPMGQGFSVAQGFAIAGKSSPRFDSYCMVGDGEVQEGAIWEAVMYAGQKHLDNFCLLVDRNNGQLDIASHMVFPMPDLEQVFRAFDWEVHGVDATSYDGVFTALERFRFGPRNGRPTAIVCHSTKGHGSLSDFMNRHKVTIPDALIAQELELQAEQRRARVQDFRDFYDSLPEGSVRDELREAARRMHLRFGSDIGFVNTASAGFADQTIGPVITRRAPRRDKRIRYDAAQLPKLDPAKEYASADIITAAMKVFARDTRVISIDADLGTTSGLEAGVAYVDQKRAMNVGVAEANMMSIGEAFAALGCNTWVSTFCPFFDWKVLRRIAVGQQERLESMAMSARAKDQGGPGGWLSEGHGLDLTFLATGPDFETRTNGATHMGNDDVTIFDGMGQLKIINVSCPQQLLAIMRWIMDGNQGLTYVRVMRAASRVLYGGDCQFEFGKASTLRENPADKAVVVTSGRAVHEALATAEVCAKSGVSVSIVDMPSIDEDVFVNLANSDKLVVFAEQNNGYIGQNCLKVLARRGVQWNDPSRMLAINTLTRDGRPQFIHSGTYEELIDAFSLSAAKLSRTILDRLKG